MHNSLGACSNFFNFLVRSSTVSRNFFGGRDPLWSMMTLEFFGHPALPIFSNPITMIYRVVYIFPPVKLQELFKTSFPLFFLKKKKNFSLDSRLKKSFFHTSSVTSFVVNLVSPFALENPSRKVSTFYKMGHRFLHMTVYSPIESSMGNIKPLVFLNDAFLTRAR